MAKTKRRRGRPLAADIDGPARIAPGHVYELETYSPLLGRMSKHYRNFDHPLDLALLRQKISDAQWAAGDKYRDLCLTVGRSGRDSTQPSVPGGSSGAPWTQTQVDAILEKKKVEALLSAENMTIVQKFCGDGCSMVDALRCAGIPFHPNGVIDRVCEALNSLGSAFLQRLPAGVPRAGKIAGAKRA